MIDNYIADMHTHSDNSHDSICRIEDMLLAQIIRGTRIMAVTDHCDIFRSYIQDIITPIRNSFETVKDLNKKYKGKCLLLSGIEISEGFWYPDICKKIINFLPYDVVIGSVHCVQHKNLFKPYSEIDFSLLTRNEIEEYIMSYFDDVIKMIYTVDFDILGHLTCPLRYIYGKYKQKIDISLFEDKIETILKLIIKKNIALEINTSSYEILNDFMPPKSLLGKYYDMGGYIITLGSDAHIKENASVNFKYALNFLKKLGFQKIYYYKSRKRFEILIK